jgi:hypothetical protein
MKERPLSNEEMDAIDKHGLYNLSQFLPKKPDDEHLRAMMEMFQASVDQEPYDADRWGQFYRPNGMRMDNNNGNDSATANTYPAPAATSSVTAASIMNRVASKPAAPVEAAPWADDEPAAPVAAAPAADKPKMQTPDEILAAIRRRQQGK